MFFFRQTIILVKNIALIIRQTKKIIEKFIFMEKKFKTTEFSRLIIMIEFSKICVTG
jgi:hypothetical protein